MQEELFTDEELKQIVEESKDPSYLRENLIHLGSDKLSIRGLCKNTGLILPYGNEWTGYKHIQERHSLTSREPYWDENRKIGNPTKFSLSTSPYDYLDIASQIFKPKNISLDRNRRSDIFDVYIGSYKQEDTLDLEYRLITYKNYKIIHTLFINSNNKPFNKRKLLNLRQGWVNAEYDLMRCVQTFRFSYFNYFDIPEFEVIVRYFEVERIEKWYVQINLDKGKPYLTALIKETSFKTELPLPFKMMQMDFDDVYWIEKIIKKIIDKEIMNMSIP